MTAAPETALTIQQVQKSFGAVRALDGLDLTVAIGQVAGLVGPNGAGKSVALRIVLGLLAADSGSVDVFGLNPRCDAAGLQRRVAYVPGDVSLWPDRTGGEAIDLLSRPRGGASESRKAELLERLGLDPTRNCRTYSTGDRQKAALVAALAADVELLVLDEPTAGLDPLTGTVVQECIAEANAAGRSVLVSSRGLGEVVELCHTVTIIRAGRMVQSGTLDELRHPTRTAIAVPLGAYAGRCGSIPGVHDLRAGDGIVTFEVGGDDVASVVRLLGDLGVPTLTGAPRSSEQLYVQYGDELASSGAAEAQVDSSNGIVRM